MSGLRICMVSSELSPWAKTGGLGDVTAALSAYLHRTGHDVRVFVPLYRRILDAGLELTEVGSVRDAELRLGARILRYSLAETRLPGGQPAYFVHCPALYDRPGLYSSAPDEHLRFVLLSRAALESCQRMGWSPQICHCNDWQTALIPLYLKTLYAWDRLFAGTRSVLTIHNIGYQGQYPADRVPDTGLAGHAALLHQEDLARGVVGFLKTGILYADALTTVSETYAREIQSEPYGMGLGALLRERRDTLFGIVNGVDYGEWSPSNDPHIVHPYSVEDPSGKELDKRALLESVGLGYEPGVPALGMVTRLTVQKGLELCAAVLPGLLARRDLRLVVVGDGEARYVEWLGSLQGAFPSKVCFYHGYSNPLAHMVEAGCDLFLMPSRYEPCGLNQMYSLSYGTIPVVRRTGGLADTVRQWDPETGEGTGFLFDHFDAEGLGWALDRALEAYGLPQQWSRLMRNAMSEDFSWDRQGRHYVELYTRLGAS